MKSRWHRLANLPGYLARCLSPRRFLAYAQEMDYRRRREAYRRRARANPPQPRPLPQLSPRPMGEIRTFAIIPGYSWHDALLPELETLGPLRRFDYRELLVHQYEKGGYDKRFFALRRQLNEKLVEDFRRARDEQGVDWVFAYAQGDHLLVETVHRLREMGAVTVNLCLDDKQSWNWGRRGGQIAGSQALAGAFDLWWTSARSVMDWIAVEGGRGLFLPEGCTPSMFPEPSGEPDIPVSFVGWAYGPRKRMVQRLRRQGVEVRAFGPGWGGRPLSSEEMVGVFQRSRINLGHGGIGHSEALTNLKGRDFDIPAAGGGAYLTTFNPDLAEAFEIGREVLCWHGEDDLIEQVRWYLERPELCREIGRRARERCLREHRWRDRFRVVLETLGLLSGDNESAHA